MVEVGQRILVNGKRKGTVRFVGTVKFGPGTWVGVELDKPTGQHDGEVQGVRYFQTPPGHGVFVSQENAADIADDDANATRIQSFYKGRKQRVEMQHQMAFKQWNELDMGEEADFLQQNAEFTKVNSILQAQSPLKAAPVVKNFLEPWQSQMASMQVDRTYTGPHLQWPLTLPQVTALVDSLRSNPDNRIHKQYLWQLLMDACSQFDEIPEAVVDVVPPNPGKLIVVGDTHGQLNDVLWIFHTYGFPSPTTHYLFNGDIADRGDYAVEIFAVLCAYKALYPNAILINRGNHECAEMNRRDREAGGGFQKEVRSKYCGATFNLFQQLFTLLPLATVVGTHTLVVHGGLFRRDGVKLSHIRTLNRRQQVPDCPTTYQDTVFFDMLWSDPMPEKGHAQQPARGPGCTRFGPDVTSRFLKSNSLERCVRSHEVPSTLRGFEVHHNARCITVFSASNYCGSTGNYGGVMIFDSGEDRPEIKEHWAPTLEEQSQLLAGEKRAEPTQAKRDMESQAKMEGKVLDKLKAKICEKRADLEWYFRRADPHKTGRVNVQEWVDGMTAVLEMELQFAKYQKELVDVDADGTIEYRKFLMRYRLEASDKHAGWQAQVLAQIWSQLMQCDYNMKDMMAVFDPSGDGLVSNDEFKALLESANTGLASGQITQLIDAIYPDGMNNITVDAFVAKFHCFYKGSTTEGLTPALQQQMQKLGACVRVQGLHKAFEQFDSDGNGFVSYAEFATAIKAMNKTFALTDAELEAIARQVDSDGNGRINYLEFVDAFSEVDVVAMAAVDSVVQGISRVLFKHKITLRRACAYFDEGSTGIITPANFRSALEAVNTLLPSPLSASQLDALVEHAGRTGSGTIDYEEFLDALEVRVQQ